MYEPEYCNNASDDIYSLGIRLIEDRECCDMIDYNNIYRISILKVCNPRI